MDEDKAIIRVCHGPTCGIRAARPIFRELDQNYKNVEACGCLDHCSRANNVAVNDTVIHQQCASQVVHSVEYEKQRQRREQAKQGLSEAEEILGI